MGILRGEWAQIHGLQATPLQGSSLRQSWLSAEHGFFSESGDRQCVDGPHLYLPRRLIHASSGLVMGG